MSGAASPISFVLPSATGRQEARFQYMSSHHVGEKLILALEIKVESQFWDRIDDILGEPPQFPLVPDAAIEVYQMLVERASFALFVQALENWLSNPTGELRFRFTTVSNDQELTFYLQDFRGPRVLPDYSVDLVCRSWMTSTVTRIAVDQSCINILRETLCEALSKVAEKGG